MLYHIAGYAVFVIPIFLGVCFVAYLVYADNNDIEIRLIPRFHLPIPWSVHSKVRRRKAEVELARTEEDLFQARHGRMQKEIILMDLEETRHRKALGMARDTMEDR